MGKGLILALDVGNTNIHGGLFDGDRLLDQWRISSAHAFTADEFGLLVSQFVRAGGLSPTDIGTVASACVVPTLYSTIQQGIRRFLKLPVLFIEPAVHDIMPIPDYQPSEIGADRLANGLAGRERYGCPLIVVDFGTATTFDVVSARGEYLGGAIAPGIEVSLGALFTKASRLPRVDLSLPGRTIGRNTVESMQSGIIHGYAGLVDNLVSRIHQELGQEAKVVATGGLAGIIAPHTAKVRSVDPTLTLEGIRLIALKNPCDGPAAPRSVV